MSRKRSPSPSTSPAKRIKVDCVTTIASGARKHGYRYKPWEAPLCQMRLDLLPPLLDIKDPDIALRARTHRSWTDQMEGDLSNEKDCVRQERECYKTLEFIGDSFLSCQMSTILNELYPDVNPGGMQDMRSTLVSNVTYSFFARHYRLAETIRTSEKEEHTGILCQQFTMADAFEAHVGGLYKDMQRRMKDGSEGNRPYMELEAWVRDVFHPRVFPYMDSYAQRRIRMIVEHRDRKKNPKDTQPPPRLAKGVLKTVNHIPHQGSFGEPMDFLGQ